LSRSYSRRLRFLRRPFLARNSHPPVSQVLFIFIPLPACSYHSRDEIKDVPPSFLYYFLFSPLSLMLLSSPPPPPRRRRTILFIFIAPALREPVGTYVTREIARDRRRPPPLSLALMNQSRLIDIFWRQAPGAHQPTVEPKTSATFRRPTGNDRWIASARRDIASGKLRKPESGSCS